MMKWTAFVGAAFIASSAAIAIGSADPESMAEAYPEFYFAQLDLTTTDCDKDKTLKELSNQLFAMGKVKHKSLAEMKEIADL